MPLQKSWRFRLGFGVRLTLVAVIGVLALTLLLRQEVNRQLENRLAGYEAEAKRSNLVTARRFTELSRDEEAARAAIVARVKEIASDQEIIRKASLQAPFRIEEVMGAVVQIVCVDGGPKPDYYAGSGTVIDASGLILTNYHVLVTDKGKLISLCGIGLTDDVARPPRIAYLAKAVASNADEDLALLRISGRLDSTANVPSLPALDITQTATLAGALQIGDPVFIGGFPGVGADTLTITQGVVAGRVGESLIKTSAYLDSGASGGAVFDSRGRFVGVPTAAARGEIGGSLGYLISGTSVQRFMDDYRAGRNVLLDAAALKH